MMLASIRVPSAASLLRVGLAAVTLNASVDALSINEIYPTQ